MQFDRRIKVNTDGEVLEAEVCRYHVLPRAIRFLQSNGRQFDSPSETDDRREAYTPDSVSRFRPAAAVAERSRRASPACRAASGAGWPPTAQPG